MGFKRTTEGRIFFQGAGENSNEEPLSLDNKIEPKREQKPLTAGLSPQQTQMQILGLLKSLNERLQATQTERNQMRLQLDTYRSVIEDLEARSEASDRALAELEQKLGGTNSENRAIEAEKMARETLKELEDARRLMLEIESKADRADRNLASLISVQKDQAQKMATATSGYVHLAKRLKDTEDKQLEIGSKVEDTLNQQARLVRKVDKAVEDRVRFMRKIERIEETVIQTRDALNARAMVLLTDQNPAAQAASGVQPVIEQLAMRNAELASPTAAGAQSYAEEPFPWKALAAIAVIAAIAVAGWYGYAHLQPNNTEQETYAEISRAEPPPETAPPLEELAAAPTQNWTTIEAEQAPEPEQVEPQPAIETPAEPNPADDIGTLDLNDQQKLAQMLETDPDALAAQLNAIEPGNPEATVTAEAQPAAEEAPVQLASAPPAQETQAAPPPAPAVPKSTAKISAPKKPAKPLSSATRNSSLPDGIKDIETQAFNGVPEAQHDLAAIYTAGHGGVKQDYKRAAFWFRQAADQGIPNARYNLGVLYHQGLGVDQDIEEAIRWYKAAADLGHPEAKYNLGIAFIEGIGVAYDPVQAASYFESAANNGVTEAAYNLGLIYENGLLGQSKPDSALMWYKRAADEGSPEAKAALEQLAKTLNIKMEDINRVVDGMKTGSAAPQKTQAAPPPATSAPVQQAAADIAAAETSPPVDDTYAAQGQQQAVIAQIQEYLMRIGLYPGPADGTAGPLTEDAIRSYQAVNNLHVDGQPTQSLLSHMKSQ